MASRMSERIGGKGKIKIEDWLIDKYVTGDEDVWRKGGLKKIIVRIEGIRKDMSILKEQMLEERREEREEWTREKGIIEKGIADLERIKKVRLNRRNNIVMKEVNWE